MQSVLSFYLKNLRSIVFVFSSALSLLLIAQDPNRFEPEILAFEKEDEQNGYQEDFILFTGSSSIRLWHSIEKDMKGFDFLNRGFGGSTLQALNKDWSRIAGEHQPDIVVLYCGENDISEGASVSETVEEFERFLGLYQNTYAQTLLIYIAMKPSQARWHLWPQYQEADRHIQKILSTTDNATFIDHSSSMLKKGTLKEDIFIEDGLHMNKKGYKGWKKQLRPVLKAQLKALNED